MPVGEMALRQYDAAHGWFARAELKGEAGQAGKKKPAVWGLCPQPVDREKL